MTIARKHLINYSQTRYYHCMSRCISQRHLLKSPSSSSTSQNYRKSWIEKHLLFLADAFALDLLSYSIMDNHTHTVLYANIELAESWSNTEVIERAARLGKVPLVCQVYLNREWRARMQDDELGLALCYVDEFRKKLTSISFFMSKLNSYIAKRANKEDDRKGHFWEGRFKSQALFGSEAVLACMAYVDLNPHRAGLCKEPAKAAYTSINYRVASSFDFSDTKLLALRNGIVLFESDYLQSISLQFYLKYVIATATKGKVDASTQAFVSSESNWSDTEIDFDIESNMAAGTNILVTDFLNRATMHRRANQPTFASFFLAQQPDNQCQS